MIAETGFQKTENFPFMNGWLHEWHIPLWCPTDFRAFIQKPLINSQGQIGVSFQGLLDFHQVKKVELEVVFLSIYLKDLSVHIINK